VLLADDTSVLVAHTDFIDFKTLNKWFKVNLLSLNFNKMHFTYFTTMRNKMIGLNVGYKDKLISNISHTNFFGIFLDSKLTWSNHFELLTTKLTTACYLIRTVKSYMSESALKNDLPLPFFHSILSYGIIFWGNLSQSLTTFKTLRKVIRVMMGHSNKNSCRNLFKILYILPLKYQYIFHLLIFVVNNKDDFIINADDYNILIRQKCNLHLPQANWAIFQNGTCYLGIKIFNSLPTEIKDLSDSPNKFKIALNLFLFTLFLYSG